MQPLERLAAASAKVVARAERGALPTRPTRRIVCLPSNGFGSEEIDHGQ